MNDLKSLRRRLGLTQAGAAKLLNVSETDFARWERGEVEPSFPNRVKIELLPTLARGEMPAACEFTKQKSFDMNLFAEHIKTCPRCAAVLAAFAKMEL